MKRKIDKASFVAPAVFRHDIPEPIERIALSALAKDPSSRPTLDEIKRRIERMDDGIPGERVRMPKRKSMDMQLTSVQKDVLASIAGPVLVHGKAGCGKTTTLTLAINALLEKGVPLSKILTCTFTNRAADDIRERLQKTAVTHTRDLWLGTIHMAAFRILRRDAERLDLNPDFVIKDAKHIVQEMGVDVGKYRINAVLRSIELIKAKGITADRFRAKNNWERVCSEVYRKYEDYTRKESTIDYDDLILLSCRLLEDNTDVRQHYQGIFDYIFVDELQDINPAQYRLIGLMSKENIFFTGDEDQAIYGWRGAQRNLMHQVQKDYPAVRVFNLNQSFRLARSIIDIASNLMHREATVIPDGHESDIIVHAAKSDEDEAHYIVKEIERLHAEDFGYRDMVILCRMNQLARIYEAALAKARIPHVLISGSSLYERGEVKLIIDYLDALRECSAGLKTPDDLASLANGIFTLPKRKAKRALSVYEYHLANLESLKPGKLIGDILDLTDINGPEIDDLQSLATSQEFRTLGSFLNQIRLLQELDLAEWNKDMVKVMTVHSAKGLQFPVVFVVDLVEDTFPLTKKMASQQEVDEERRLCYVALTRAQKKLYLLYPKWRHGRYQHPSRFLVEMFKTAL